MINAILSRSVFDGDATPQLTKSIQDDMYASALDAFLRHGDCSKTLLLTTYGFQPHQVQAFGDTAILDARYSWLGRKIAGDAA